jgi:PhnB protein
MAFYKECLGGKLVLQTIGESPMSEKLPAKMKKNILHATLTKGDMILMASDMVPETGLNKGNSVSLVLDCKTERELKLSYEKLSTGGQATHPLENTFWGGLFGDLTDRYGNHWLLNYTNKKPPENKSKK